MNIDIDEMVYTNPNGEIGAYCSVKSLSEDRVSVMRFRENYNDPDVDPAYFAVIIDDGDITTGVEKVALSDVKMAYDIMDGNLDGYVIEKLRDVYKKYQDTVDLNASFDRITMNPRESIYVNSDTGAFCPTKLMSEGRCQVLEISDGEEPNVMISVEDDNMEILNGDGLSGNVRMALDLAAGRTSGYERTTYGEFIEPDAAPDGP